MRNVAVVLVLPMFVGLLIVGGSTAFAGPKPKDVDCTTIKDGSLTHSAGHYLDYLTLGYDPYGYNYQAHMFNGLYANAYLGRDGLPPYQGDDEAYLAENPEAANNWYWEYRDVQLVMKWNDAWLSNKDCDGDGLLDRHYGYDTYIGSGAWETNHQKGVYNLDDEDECNWGWFVKIVAAPGDAYAEGGYWYTVDGEQIGFVLWGSFAEIMSVYNDPCEDAHGVEYLSPYSAGFGRYGPQQ